MIINEALALRDFSTQSYRTLVTTLLQNGYECIPYVDYALTKHDHERIAILRNDVDSRPLNSLRIARIQHELGVKATYYFRFPKDSSCKNIIQQVFALGHEIGYHYEDLALAHGNLDVAIRSFQVHLEQMRQLSPIRTICMHGSPLSRWDNRLLWQEYDYRDFGICGEPYLDLDFAEFHYLSDTGRRWDGSGVSVRDKVHSCIAHKLRSTTDVVRCLNSGVLSDKLLVTVHPQRWNSDLYFWSRELVWQHIKNIIKRFIFVK